jgi:diguanylate cyclase (GGDEF)-like protein
MMDKVIFDTIDNGILVLDENLCIKEWNRWLEIQTSKKKIDVVGENFCELFPYVSEKKLKRKIKSVLITQNPSFYSIDPHNYLIKIPLSNITNSFFDTMQQNVTIVPYDIEKNEVAIYIYNDTSLCETNAKLKMLNIELEYISHRDPLTHLYNRRYFTEEVEKRKSVSIRNNTPICIVMLDIDKFKNINDTYGHLIGDKVIIEVAKSLNKYLRNSDIVARFGGEEFIILLENSDLQNSFDVAEKIRQKIEESLISSEESQKPIKFTASFGVAQFDQQKDDNNIEKTILNADRALYEAKESGRNKTIIAK